MKRYQAVEHYTLSAHTVRSCNMYSFASLENYSAANVAGTWVIELMFFYSWLADQWSL